MAYDGKEVRTRKDTKDPYFNFELRRARLGRGYTLKQLAERAGVALPTMANYERLGAVPGEETAKKIADYLGKDVGELFPQRLREMVADIRRERKSDSHSRQEVSLDEVPEEQFGFVENQKFDVPLEMLKGEILRLLNSLPWKLGNVLKRRYGIGYERPSTLEEVGGVLNLSKERIRLLEMEAMRKLQKRAVRERLLDFV